MATRRSGLVKGWKPSFRSAGSVISRTSPSSGSDRTRTSQGSHSTRRPWRFSQRPSGELGCCSRWSYGPRDSTTCSSRRNSRRKRVRWRKTNLPRPWRRSNSTGCSANGGRRPIRRTHRRKVPRMKNRKVSRKRTPFRRRLRKLPATRRPSPRRPSLLPLNDLEQVGVVVSPANLPR